MKVPCKFIVVAYHYGESSKGIQSRDSIALLNLHRFLLLLLRDNTLVIAMVVVFVNLKAILFSCHYGLLLLFSLHSASVASGVFSARQAHIDKLFLKFIEHLGPAMHK